MRHRFLFAALAAGLLTAAPARAQFVPGSDVQGPVFGSGVAGVGYHGTAFRDIENALFRRVRDRVVFRSPAVARAMSARAATLNGTLRAGELRVPESWPDQAPPSRDAQRAVADLLNAEADTGQSRRVLAALRGGQPGAPGDPAEVLVTALAGLFRTPETAVDARGRWVAGERWESAFRAYEAYLNTAPAAVLDPPPAELVVIGLVLRDLVDAGVAASRR